MQGHCASQSIYAMNTEQEGNGTTTQNVRIERKKKVYFKQQQMIMFVFLIIY